jgi:hypothetical protein
MNLVSLESVDGETEFEHCVFGVKEPFEHILNLVARQQWLSEAFRRSN